MVGDTTTDGEKPGNPLRWLVWGGAACLLLLPLVAMQFTSEVNWDGRDFALIGVMLLIGCATYEMGAWLGGSPAYRAGFGLAAITGFVIIWVNLAVGMIAGDGNPYNLAFGGVLAAALVGALFARFKPLGMARTMVAAAAAQALVAGVALVAGWDMPGSILAGGFAVPWLASAWLFNVSADSTLSRARQKLKVHAVLSLLAIGFGGLLLVMMVTREGEPGLVPLVLIAASVGWFLFVRSRERKLA